MQQENFVWRLMARSLSGEATKEEIALLNEQLEADENLKEQYNILNCFWNQSNQGCITEKDKTRDIQKILDKASIAAKFENTIRSGRKRLARRRLLVISCVSALIISSVIFLYSNNKANRLAKNQPAAKSSFQLVTQKGNRTRTVLPDGSMVWLNAGSELTYNSFTKNYRQVYLKGEAYFDVTKDAGHPFIVHANSIDIKVLGTAFNVKSYTEDNKVEATLIRGMIQVIRQDKINDDPVFLHPNEKIVIDLNQPVAENKVNTEHALTQPVFKLYHLDSMIKAEDLVETSWVYDKLEFRGESFEELAKKLERWYNIKIFFQDEQVKNLSFNGSFENETMEQAFEALKDAVPFKYDIQNDEVFVTSSD